jgi:helicase MOV-10
VDDDAVFYCEICDTTEWNGEAHLRSVRHRNKEAYTSVRAALDEAEKDKYGICVSHGDKDGVDFGIVDTGGRYELRLTITSTIPNTKYLLLSVKFSSSHASNTRSRNSSYVTLPRVNTIR